MRLYRPPSAEHSHLLTHASSGEAWLRGLLLAMAPRVWEGRAGRGGWVWGIYGMARPAHLMVTSGCDPIEGFETRISGWIDA